MMNNFLNGMFGKVGSGMCRLSMNGGIAVKTNGGYKTYNRMIKDRIAAEIELDEYAQFFGNSEEYLEQ